ncbi:unnamed protein product [Acanthoscelides obtectus]|uniref:Cytochrome b5 heme-binding domain-containing protein n=1 Tax=Acanthoscelides obtectus TaxID=200917 RepID=A0A9P0LF15_ACAOB|nr:unnamed protein product [Acanthoscelides obtectus]CAK1622403.1 Cytochrome b5 [Acanthoscelides obtectus]
MSNFWFCKYLTGRLKLTTHPGGRDIIEEHAGKDATKYFLNIGHSSEAKNNLKALKIGEVAEEFPVPSNLWAYELRKSHIYTTVKF